MKLRKTLAMILAVLMLAFMAVPAVSAEEDIPVPDCGNPYLALVEMLQARLEVAREVAEADTGYTQESFNRLYMAIMEAEIFLYYSNGTEAEAQALIDELNSAMESLEKPVTSGDEIPFTLVTECRVQYYYPDSGDVLHLVKSVEEMDAILDTIHGSPDDKWQPKPVRDEKYNDEYFKENALVIGLYVFGSGSVRQSIDMLAVDGDTLTVFRTLRYPEIGTDDMMLRYALMEVKNSDIEGVVNVKDSYARASLGVSEKVYGLLGDVNNDNTVNIKDATSLQKHIAQLHMLFGANLFLADANGDTDVNIKDATEIQKCIAGFELESSVGGLTKVLMPVIYDKAELALTELHHTIVKANNRIAPGSNFVGATVARLMDEIEKAEALLESKNPDYDDVVAQIAALNEAVEGLEIVNLDISELVPLMNEAEDIVYWGGYTDSSLEVLKEAKSTGQLACLYGQSQDEVTQAVAELKSALDALVPAPDPEATDIDFTLAQACRVWSYGPSGTQLYLVKSPAEMDEVLATIEGQNTAVYTKPERDEKYNEEFFKENSLVISLNKLDCGSCSQIIDKVTVKGDTLTVCRTIEAFEEGKDKNYQYVLLEVANADIEGVTKLENGTTYARVICGLPVVYEDIPFEILDRCRIGWFDDYDKAVYIVNSPEEMDAVLATIEDDGFYERPVRDESLNEEYFEEHSLIISMALVGGSCCSQSINKLSRVGDEMTLYRTVYQEENNTPDMNFEYVLLEVDKEYTTGVKTIKDEVSVKVDSDNNNNNNNNKNENIEVYFTNTKGWANVNIHYWNETETTQWPGKRMEFVENNIYGQDVYCYEIPADIVGVVFNDAIGSSQTVDILTNIKDGWGFYPSETEDGKWLVESYEYIIPDPVPTSAYVPVLPADEPATADETEIDFVEVQQCKVQGWGELYDENQQELYIVRSVAEFDAVLEYIEGSPEDTWRAKPVRDEKYDDQYFISDALVVCLYPMGSGSYTFSTDKLTIDGENLTVYRTVYMPTVSDCEVVCHYALLEVDVFDVKNISTIDVVTDYQFVNVDG